MSRISVRLQVIIEDERGIEIADIDLNDDKRVGDNRRFYAQEMRNIADPLLRNMERGIRATYGRADSDEA